MIRIPGTMSGHDSKVHELHRHILFSHIVSCSSKSHLKKGTAHSWVCICNKHIRYSQRWMETAGQEIQRRRPDCGNGKSLTWLWGDDASRLPLSAERLQVLLYAPSIHALPPIRYFYHTLRAALDTCVAFASHAACKI